VGSLRASGGTAIYPGLVHARDLLEGVASATRHVIVMTDGLSQPGDFEGVLGELRAMGISTSFVGIGDGADRNQLTRLAELGGGALHLTQDVRALPAIMALETMQLGADPVERERLPVRWTEPRPAFLRGIEGSLPALEGYVRTTPKPEASVHLTDPAGEVAVLASWRYGLGRVVAFASQVIGPWAGAWTSDESLHSLWPQVTRWTAGDVRRAGLSFRARPDGARLELEVDAIDDSAMAVTGLGVRVELVGPDGEEAVRSVRLSEVRPGRYAGAVRIEGESRPMQLRAVVDDAPRLRWSAPSELTVVMPSPLTATPASTGPSATRLAEALASRDPAGRRWLPWTLIWSATSAGWIVVAIAAFMSALLARYRPGWFSWRRLPSRPAGDRRDLRPPSRTGSRATRQRSSPSANTKSAGVPAAERGTP
jgi:hypothetical protein